MNATESLTLTRFVRATCPQQKFDEYTPDAWFTLLGDLTFDDCRAAAVALGKRQPFISPAEIRTEVARLRVERIKANMTDPEYDRDDVAGGIAAIRQHRRALGDGAIIEAPRVLHAEVEKVEKFVGEFAARKSIAS